MIIIITTTTAVIVFILVIVALIEPFSGTFTGRLLSRGGAPPTPWQKQEKILGVPRGPTGFRV